MPDPTWLFALNNASTSVVKGKQRPNLSSCKVTSSHFAGLSVALKFKANFLTFNKLRHARALYSGDVNEYVSVAVVRLDEAEAFSVIKPFNCASGHNKPFHSSVDNPQ